MSTKVTISPRQTRIQRYTPEQGIYVVEQVTKSDINNWMSIFNQRPKQLDTDRFLPCDEALLILLQECGYALLAQAWCFVEYYNKLTGYSIAINEMGLSVRMGAELLLHIKKLDDTYNITLILHLQGYINLNQFPQFKKAITDVIHENRTATVFYNARKCGGNTGVFTIKKA